MNELIHMTRAEWVLFAVVTVLCVVGLLLPKFGNQLGHFFLGDDPTVVVWRNKWAKRRQQGRERRLARRAARKARKAEKRESS